MPRIDPQQLLKTLGVLLAPNGGIKSSEEVIRLVTLMHKFSRKLVSKCVYVQILKNTPPDLLERFLDEKGWDLINVWFADAIGSKNWPFCLEMIQLFSLCPISAERLKDNVETNSAPRLINTLRQEGKIDLAVRQLASDVYQKWVQVVSPEKKLEDVMPIKMEENNSNGSIDLLKSLADEVSENLKKEEIKAEAVPPAAKKIKREEKRGSSKDHDSKKSSSSSSSSSSHRSSKDHSSSSSKDKDRDVKRDKREKRYRPDRRDEVGDEQKAKIKEIARRLKEEEQSKKDKDTLRKLAGGSTSKLAKIPKIPKKSSASEAEKKKAAAGGGLSFEAMMGGLDSKPKTVKTPLNKNKTAAMLEDLKKSASSKSSSKSPDSKSSSSHKRDHHHHSSHHSSHHHKKDSPSPSTTRPKPTINLSETKITSVGRRNSETESPKIKVTSPHNMAESNMFANALEAKYVPRKKKRRLSELDDKEKGKKSPEVKKETAKAEEEAPVSSFSFYRDTLDEPEAEKEDGGDQSSPEGEEKESAAKEKENKSPSPSASPKIILKDEDMPFQQPDELPREVKGILVYHRGMDRRNKKIQWRAETDLVATRFFELDTDERVNVNKIKFEKMREAESQMEKAAVKNKDSLEDKPAMLWYKPEAIEVDNREPFTPGSNSKEKDSQAEREGRVLAALYFSKEKTPATPAEPEAELTLDSKEPVLIPLEDIEQGPESDYVYDNDSWPVPKVNNVDHHASLASSFSLPPALSNLLSTMGNKFGSNKGDLSQEEIDTLAAQTEAMKAMGMLPDGSGPIIEAPPLVPPPNTRLPPPQMNQPPPVSVPPPRFNAHQPPPMGEPPMVGGGGGGGYSTGGFNGPPPMGGGGFPSGPPPRMGGPPPHMNGNFNGPPPGGPPFRGGNNGGNFNNGRGFHGGNRGGGPPFNNRGGFHAGNNRGGGMGDNRNSSSGAPPFKTRPCLYYDHGKGFCREGDQCSFIHD